MRREAVTLIQKPFFASPKTTTHYSNQASKKADECGQCFSIRLKVNQMHGAKGKGYLKWTSHVANLTAAELTTPQTV